MASLSSRNVPATRQDERRFERENYERDGFCYVRGAVAQADVESLKASLWDKAELQASATWNGLKRDQPKTYPTRWPNLSISLFPEPSHLWQPLWNSSKLKASLNNLLGEGNWIMPIERYCFYFPLKFPEPHEKGAIATATNSRGEEKKGWHVDLGKSFAQRGLTGDRTLACGPEHACVVLFILSDTDHNEGGTVFVRGSPRLIERALRDAGSLSHQKLLRFCNSTIVEMLENGSLRYPSSAEENEISSTSLLHSFTGKAGDVVIFHPWCIHAASRNFTESARVRFMGNATVRYREDRFKPWFTSETSDDPNVRAATPAL